MSCPACGLLERVIGIEPTSSAWKADALTVVLYPHFWFFGDPGTVLVRARGLAGSLPRICFHGLTITVLRPACYILWPTPRAMRQPPLRRGVVLVPLHDYIMFRIGSGVLSLSTRAPGFNGWSVASITDQHLHQGDTIGGASTLCTIAALDLWFRTDS